MNLQVALVHIARIKELFIKAYPACCTQVQPLLADLPISAPLLESLTISMGDGIMNQRQDRCRIPPTALSDVNCLRKLQLLRCDIDWESLLFGTQLTYLSVEDVLADSRPSTTQLLTILQRVPGLRHLALQSCLPMADGHYVDASSAEEDSIHLPHLDTLVLSGKLVELQTWLRRMTIPLTSSIKLQCGPGDPEATGALLDLLRVRLRSSGIPLPIRTLKINNTIYPQHSRASVTLTGPELLVTRESRDSSSFLPEICNDVSVGGLTCLHIASSASIDPQLIANTLGRLPCLEIVRVFARVVTDFVRSLTLTSSAIHSSSLSFPQLRQIHLVDVISRTADDFGSLSFESLRDCLVERRDLGFEIEEVSVYRSSSVSPQDIALLREIVPQVDWDGKDAARTPSCGISYQWEA